MVRSMDASKEVGGVRVWMGFVVLGPVMVET